MAEPQAVPDNTLHVMNGEPAGTHGHKLHLLMLGTALVAGAVILSPYVLPALGIGTGTAFLDAIYSMHAAGEATGLVGAITTGLHTVPFIGETLAAGGLASAAISGGTGIGGVLLGRFLEKKHDGKTGVNWGKVIKYGALLTSAFIALPSILTGISIGIVYLCGAFSTTTLAGSVLTILSNTVGTMAATSTASIGLSGAAVAMPHLLTCGAALLPAVFSFNMAGKHANMPQASAPPTTPQVISGQATSPSTDGAIIAALEVDKPTSANMPVNAKLRLSDARTGLPITDDELAITHTRKLHLYVTDQSLKQYHHIHPHPTGEPGVLAFSFTPQTSNTYNAWADFTLVKDGSNHRIKIAIPSALRRNIPAMIKANTEAQQDGLVFNWKSSEPLQKGKAAIVEVNVSDALGNPITNLEPVMGAFAHLAGFSADGKHFIHTHPLGAEPISPDERGGPKLRFHVEPEYFGPTQFYLQVCRDGKEVHVPFGQQIKPPEQLSEKIYAANHSAMQMAGM